MQGQLLEKVQLMVGVPTMGNPEADFALCLSMMAHDLSFPLAMVKAHTFVIVFERGSMIVQQRENLVETAKQGGATHLLMVDDDMVFPQQIARVLLSRRCSVVAANCVTKTFPANATARDEGPGAGTPIPISPKPDVACRKVWRVGTGVMLLDMKIFETLGDPPYFGTRWDVERKRHVYEDWVFLEKVEAAGIPIYIDEQVSPLIGHIGKYTFSWQDQASPQEDTVSAPAQPNLILATE